MAPSKQPPTERHAARLPRRRALAARPAFHLAMVALIVAWIGLTVTEIAVGEASEAGGWLRRLSVGLAAVFVVELALRWRAASTTRRFLRDHWLDVVTVASAAPGLATLYFDLFVEMKKAQNVTLVAVIGTDGKTRINPGDVRLAKGEDLVVIAQHDFNG